MTMKDLEQLDQYMVASMVARNTESINELKEEIKKLKKRLMKTNQILRIEQHNIDKVKTQMKLFKKRENASKRWRLLLNLQGWFLIIIFQV